jgi:hypothetical protein
MASQVFCCRWVKWPLPSMARAAAAACAAVSPGQSSHPLDNSRAQQPGFQAPRHRPLRRSPAAHCTTRQRMPIRIVLWRAPSLPLSAPGSRRGCGAWEAGSGCRCWRWTRRTASAPGATTSAPATAAWWAPLDAKTPNLAKCRRGSARVYPQRRCTFTRWAAVHAHLLVSSIIPLSDDGDVGLPHCHALVAAERKLSPPERCGSDTEPRSPAQAFARRCLPGVPVLALTATAAQKVSRAGSIAVAGPSANIVVAPAVCRLIYPWSAMPNATPECTGRSNRGPGSCGRPNKGPVLNPYVASAAGAGRHRAAAGIWRRCGAAGGILRPAQHSVLRPLCRHPASRGAFKPQVVPLWCAVPCWPA